MTAAPIPLADPARVGQWAGPAAWWTAHLRRWPACRAGCGWPLDPKGDDGTGTHPTCDTRPQLQLIHGGTTA